MASYGLSVAPSNPAVLYSPYTWAALPDGTAKTISAGAYLRLMFTGNSCAGNFDVSNMGSPASQLYSRIDGYGPWQKQNVAGGVYFGPGGGQDVSPDLAAAPWHLLELVVKSTSETLNRWNAPSQTAVILQGIDLDSGAQVALPRRAVRNLLALGDSITEGVRTVNRTAANDTDRNDAMLGWAFALGRLLGAEVGVVGFGATGLTHGGSGNVPPATAHWNTLLPGVPRPLTPAPDLIVVNQGTNDASASAAAVTGALLALLSSMLAATPVTTKIAVLRPFGGFQAAALQAAVSQVNSPRVSYIDTTGVLINAFGLDDLSLHPLGPNDLGLIGPGVAALLAPLITSGQPVIHPFRRMF